MNIFFNDRQLLLIIDQLARRYNRMPYEIVNEMSIEEFDFNIAVMYIAQIEANKEAEKRQNEKATPSPGGPKGGWGSYGISRKIVQKGKT